MMASCRFIRDNESIKLNNFLNRLLVEIMISSYFCAGFTEYRI